MTPNVPMQRQRHRDARNERRPAAPQEDEHHQDHEDDRDDERPLDVVHRGANRRGAIERDRQVDSAGEQRAGTCGSSARTRSTVSMTLAPGSVDHEHQHAGFPLASPPMRTFSTESVTCAEVGEPDDGAVARRDDERHVVDAP